MKLTTNPQRLLFEMFSQEFQDNEEYSKDSDFFEFFATKQIMKSKEFSDEEIENGICGSHLDGGCDAIYTLLNDINITEDALEDINFRKNSQIDLIIIQTKKESSFKEDPILKWKTVIKNLLAIGTDNSHYETRYNEDVLSAFSLFRDLYVKMIRNNPKLNISFYYASFASEIDPNVQAQAKELEESVRELYPQSNVTVSFWGAEKLLNIAQTSNEHRLNLHLAETSINIGTHQDYVALVSLVDYYRFISDEDHMLRKYIFESNVRDYQGHNAVNQDIEDTLTNDAGEDFWWLNNGITLLTDEATLVTSKELILTEPAIVNGLQTSNEIYRYFENNPDKILTEKRNILVRIIVPESEDSRDRIILATNNQTSIPKSSLRANDPIHWQIELYFKGRHLYYDRRKNYYKNQGKKSNEIISVSFLAQCMISLLLQKPNYARARPSTLLTKDETYNQLYIDNQDLDVFYNAARLGRTIDSTLKKSNKFTQAQKNDILFYVLYFAVARRISKTRISATDVKNLDLSIFTEEYILQIADTVFSEYCQLGGDGKVAKGIELITSLMSLISENKDHIGVE